jgi:hypothetical protein
MQTLSRAGFANLRAPLTYCAPEARPS